MDTKTATHTPGPWTVERVPIQSRGGSNTAWKIGPFAACIYDDWRPREAGISEAENEANARLIARAPELLEENERLRKRLEEAEAIMTQAVSLQVLGPDGMEWMRAFLEGE